MSDLASDSTAHSASATDHNPPVPWGYTGDIAPQRWAEIDDAYSVCALGHKQSPIDLADLSPSGDGPDVQIHYEDGQRHIVHPGFTVQANFDGGGHLRVDGEVYTLQQVHFHHPSEHTVEGTRFPMEMHLVHQNQAGQLAVLGVLMEESDTANPAFTALWNDFATYEGDADQAEPPSLDPSTLLPSDLTYAAYDGSLTTPPCSEDVQWIVLLEPVALSADQIEQYRALHPSNARPLQPRNERTIYRGTATHR